MPTESVYLKILKNKSEPIIYDNENWFIILAKEPINEGHLLVIPKKPSKKFYETPTIDEGFKLATKFAKVLQKTYKAPRISLFIKGFSIENHAHIHVFPVYNRDDMHRNKEDLRSIDIVEMEEVANKLKAHV